MQYNLWITVGDERVCPTCEDKDGEIKSVEEWAADGFPGGGADICGDKCRCICVPYEYVDPALREMSKLERIRTLEAMGLTRVRPIPGRISRTMIRLGYPEVLDMSATELKEFFIDKIRGISYDRLKQMTLTTLSKKFFEQEGILPEEFNF